MTDVALLEVADRVATVTLNRPEARNALSSELIKTLATLVADADERDDVDVLILTGADPAFCAGLDLKELGRDGGPLRDLARRDVARRADDSDVDSANVNDDDADATTRPPRGRQ